MKDISELAGWDAGEAVITVDAPAGENPRNGEDFEQIEEQINRLVNISDNQTVDWQTVADLAEGILRKQGKDLSVAVWFLVARMHIEKLTGLAIGIHVLRDSVCQYWQEMSPPLRRMHARRNIIYWLFEQIKDYLEKEQEPDPISDELHQQLLADWSDLDQFWLQHDEDDSPPFFGLRRVLESLPVSLPLPITDSTVESEENPEDNAKDNQDIDIAEKKASDETQEVIQEKKVIERHQKEPLSETGNETDDATAAYTPSPIPNADFDKSPVDIIDKALENFNELIDWGLSQPPIDGLFFRLNRICAWTTIESLPQNKDKQTYIPAPTQQLMTSWEKIRHQGDAQSQLHFAESRLGNHRFWLDLNRFSYEALLTLEQVEAANIIKDELTHLANRIPGLVELTFSDGQAFADAETRQWIADMMLPKEAHAAPVSQDDTDLLIQQVLSASGKNNVAQSLEKLQIAAQRTASLREHFRLQTAQLEVLSKNQCSVNSTALITPLLDKVKKYHLVEWEPMLMSKFLIAGIKLTELDAKAKVKQKKLLLHYLSSVSMKDTWDVLKN